MEGWYSDLPAVAAQQTECGTEVIVTWRDVKYGYTGVFGASILSRTSLDGGKHWFSENRLTTIPDGTLAEPSLNGGVRAVSWWKEAVPAETAHVAIRGSNRSLSDLSPELDVTPDVYTGFAPELVVSTHAIHLVWEEQQGSTFRIYYRRGEFIQSHPTMSISSGLVTYDSTEINNTRIDSVTVTNTSADPLTIGTAISVDEDFSVYPDSATIQAGLSKTFIVFFTPKTAGLHSGKVLLYHNGGTSPDCFSVSGVGIYSKRSISYEANSWNLVSIPLKSGPAQTLPMLYSFQTSYQQEDTLVFGKGYWAKPDATEVNYLGVVTSEAVVDVTRGWNLIGSVSVPIPVVGILTQPDSLISSPFYGFNNSGYTQADTIYPGKSYWVRVNINGHIILKNN
jgi:hypothetical protein